MSPTPNPIHATNAWNPTGRTLQPVPGTRLYYAHADALGGPRTFVLLGNQHHLTFVADLEGHVAPETLRDLLIERYGLYPHLLDLDPAPGLPRLFEEQSPASPQPATHDAAESTPGVDARPRSAPTGSPPPDARSSGWPAAGVSPAIDPSMLEVSEVQAEGSGAAPRARRQRPRRSPGA